MTDDAPTDAWTAGERFRSAHPQHLRIAWVLHKPHGRKPTEELLVRRTRQACQLHG